MVKDSVVSVSVADIRYEPQPDAELVTQALMNVPALSSQVVGDWTAVTLPDYTGWIRSAELEEPLPRSYCKVGEQCTTPLQLTAVLLATHTPLYAQPEGEETSGLVYLSTALPLVDTTQHERVQVALPGEYTAWLNRSAIAIRQVEPIEALYPPTPVSIVTNYARAFLNVPYLWGGTTWQGLDCSGLVQLCYRMGGSFLPRDAYQQHDFLTHAVERAEMQEGDLLFFGTQRITHVALALNNREYIHAEGQNYHRVLINSFHPDDAHYYPRLDAILWGIKRVLKPRLDFPQAAIVR